MLVLALQLGGEAVREAREKTAAAAEDDVAKQHAAQIRVEGSNGGGDEPRYRLGQVWV